MTTKALTQHRVLPTLAIDSRGRLLAAVCSDEVVAVCLHRMEEEPMDADLYSRLLREEGWAALLRHQDNAYFLTSSGIAPSEGASASASTPEEMEAVHMAIEIGLATWPEWGATLRESFKPKDPIRLHLRPGGALPPEDDS